MSATSPCTTVMSPRLAWLLLLTLVSAFALSQAYRTVAGILSVPLIADFGLSAQQMGMVAAAFHFAFGGLQLVMGIGIDMFGIRRTILAAFPLAILGAALSALAPSFLTLIAGQALIGVGCAPAFLVCTVFVARHFPPQRFAAMQGVALGLGGLGLIATGTPLAWLVQHYGWRMAYWVLCATSVLVWLLIFTRVRLPAETAADTQAARPTSLWDALQSYGVLLRMPHTAGILSLVFVGYAAFITLRGLWLAPYLSDRFGQSLIFSGNVALTLSVIALFAPSLFGRLDPGDDQRRKWLAGFPWALVALFALLAFTQHLTVAVGTILAIAVCMGATVWQYADVRISYPSHMVGRAMALFTMSMFLGIAVMQSVTGAAAGWSLAQGLDKYMAVFGTIAALLAAGSCGYILLPKPRQTASDHGAAH
ncbi:MFS transporter [Lampropedia cohaerens]|uniref:MFS transporter n=1 Tax=Lampropedia cohaerens TaxID=1610491 RepID=A0A0U1PZY9_9BURK|nr:MFS transporter [Lampropedia cohaerens]KKW68093.1 MFS transporter [Lampropedia cohaerens]